MQHTPAPWYAEYSKTWGWSVRTSELQKRRPSDGVLEDSYIAYRLRNKADAYLIASAPDCPREQSRCKLAATGKLLAAARLALALITESSDAAIEANFDREVIQHLITVQGSLSKAIEAFEGA